MFSKITMTYEYQLVFKLTHGKMTEKYRVRPFFGHLHCQILEQCSDSQNNVFLEKKADKKRFKQKFPHYAIWVKSFHFLDFSRIMKDFPVTNIEVLNKETYKINNALKFTFKNRKKKL